MLPWTAPLVRGRFVRRYKRFFVDVVVEGSDDVVTAHTANTGAMTGMLIDGAPVLLTRHEGGSRKLPLELEAIDVGTSWICCNTIRANRVAEAIVAAHVFVDDFGAFSSISREQTLGDSRVDLCLVDDQGATACFVEVKSVTLRSGDVARFPDAVSERATKHVDNLARVARKHRKHGGPRAALLYLVQRDDCAAVGPAKDVDPAYARAVKRAVSAGVVVVAAAVSVDEHGTRFTRRLPMELT